MEAEVLLAILRIALGEDPKAEVDYSDQGMNIIGKFSLLKLNIKGKASKLEELGAHIVSNEVIQVEVL